MNEYMEVAYKEALKAFKKNEIPVGAIIVKNNKIVAKCHNDRQKKNNVLGHAEIKAILKAERKIKDWRLDGCDMYVTLEPCEMCSIIIEESRIDNVYFLTKQKEHNADAKYIQTNDCNKLQTKYQKILNDFFKKLR